MNKLKLYYVAIELITLFIFVFSTDFFNSQYGATNTGLIYSLLMLSRVLLFIFFCNKVKSDSADKCIK